MSFAERVLRFSFSGARSGSFSAAGLRAAVNIQSYPERLGSTAQVKVWGLSESQMNAYSSKMPTVPAGIQVQLFNLIIEAGELGSPLTEVVNGPIFSSFIDLGDTPDSSFNITMIDTYLAATPIAAQSQPGSQNAEDLIAAICPTASLTFDNSSGAHSVLRNQAAYGSAIDQIARIARAANFGWHTYGKTLFIWPRGQSGQAAGNAIQAIDVGPNTDPQMVGYPSWWDSGLIVTSLYNPKVQINRQMNVVGSSIRQANGLWQIIGVQHDLTTMLPKGPWFTTAKLISAT